MSRRDFLFGMAALPFCLAACRQKEEASVAPPTPVRPATQVAELINAPVKQLDYLRAKLAFDKMVDATIDTGLVSASISRMVAFASEMAGPAADDVRKLAAVRTVIYRAGSWNEGRPFAYDLTDPYGQNPRSKLLSTYLTTRLGNCVSMPTLFLILADQLGVNVAFAEAPLHVFVRYIAADASTVNLEATSGALPARDQWYREKLPMTDLAVKNGLYLRTLSRKEGVALLADTVLEHLMDQARYFEAIEVANVIMAAYPLNAYALLKQGTAYAFLLEKEFYRPYPNPDMVPPALYGRYRELSTLNQQAFARAEAMGWMPTEIQGKTS